MARHALKEQKFFVGLALIVAYSFYRCFIINKGSFGAVTKGRKRIPLVFGSVARAGSTYGGWGYLPNLLTPDSIVYSIGLGEDLTWDSEIINRHHCKVFGFDNTPVHMQYWSNLLNAKMPPPPEGKKFRTFFRNFVHTELLLLEKDGEVELALPQGHSASYALNSVNGFKENTSTFLRGKSIINLMRMHNHVHIDILKLDIEGSEFVVVSSWLKINLPPVCQILVELHDRLFEKGLELSRELFKTLDTLGFTPIDVHFGANDPDGAVSFINERACCKIIGKLCSMERHLFPSESWFRFRNIF